MAPPQFRSKLPVGRSSSANSTLPGNPSSAQPSRSAAPLFRTSQRRIKSNVKIRIPRVEKSADKPSICYKFSIKKKKLRDYVSEEIKTLKQGMDAVASALDRGNPHNFTEVELYSELRKVEGLKKVPAIEIYSKLATNISAARTFLGLPPEDRAIWLSVEFGSDIFDDPNVPF